MLCVYGMIYGLYYFVGMCSKFLRIMYDFGLGYVMVICKQEFLYIITLTIVLTFGQRLCDGFLHMRVSLYYQYFHRRVWY